MKRRGWGRIANIASDTIALQVPDTVHHVTSKMGVIGLTRGLAIELTPYGIIVNAVAPSATRTPGMSVAPDEILAAVAAQQTIKHTEEPDDLAGAVAFQASSDADFITAQTLFVDGGLVRS